MLALGHVLLVLKIRLSLPIQSPWFTRVLECVSRRLVRDEKFRHAIGGGSLCQKLALTGSLHECHQEACLRDGVADGEKAMVLHNHTLAFGPY